MHGGVAAQGGGAGAGLDGFGVFAAGFAQVGVDVHHAGQRDQAGGLNDGGAARRGQVLAACGDDAVADQEVLGGSAEDGGAADQVGAGAGVLLL